MNFKIITTGQHNLITRVALCVLYVLYIYRQTFHAEPIVNKVNYGIILAFIIFILINRDKIFKDLKASINLAMFIGCSVIISGVLHHEINYVRNEGVKLLIIASIIKYVISTNTRVLRDMADVGVIFIIAIIAMSQIELIPSAYSINGVWVKNYGGFVNPNIATYFLFSSLVVHLATNSTTRLYVLATLMFVVGFYLLDLYSRTHYIGAALLIIYSLMSYSRKNQEIYARYLIRAIIIIVPTYLVASSITLTGFIDSDTWRFIDRILSSRLTVYGRNTYSLQADGPIIKQTMIDNVYYEAFVVFGPFALYLIWKLYQRGFSVSRKGGENIKKNLFIGFIFLLIGTTEGYLVKLSPALIIFYIILLQSRINIDEKHNSRRIKSTYVRSIKLSIIGFVSLAVFYLFNVSIYKVSFEKPVTVKRIEDVSNEYYCKGELKFEQNRVYEIKSTNLEYAFACIANALKDSFNPSKNVIPYINYDKKVFSDPTEGKQMTNPVITPNVTLQKKSNTHRYIMLQCALMFYLILTFWTLIRYGKNCKNQSTV